MRIPRVEYTNATGLFDKVIGLGREIVGEVIANDRLIKSGEAQQAKGSEKLKAVREQAKAEAHRAKARGYEMKERASQESKAS